MILNELGTGLAGRGGDLRQAIINANPALKQTDKVLAILADQNRVLANLARDGDTILAPLARSRAQVADFVTQANSHGQATAERSSALEQNIAKLPAFLRELTPTMQLLGGLADQMTPVLTDLGAEAPSINRFIEELGPFSQAGIPALQSLGAAADVGGPALTKSKPIITDVGQLASAAKPLTNNLASLLTSLKNTGGIERLMDYLFYQVAAINGFDADGHYLRAGLILNACSQYAIAASPDCLATFDNSGGSSARAASATTTPGYADTRRSPSLRKLDAVLRGQEPGPRRRRAGVGQRRREGRHERRCPRRRGAGARGAAVRARRRAESAAGLGQRPGVGAARLPARRRRLMRRGSASIAANPVLIGAATTLVIIVAVFLAYNANSGLPFVPTYEVKTQVPNAAQLVKGNDVRIGGTRVGAVTDITPVTAKDGSVSALLTLKLETSVKPLPVDSTVLIRPRSALGLKYVEITKGTSSQGYDDGATIPLHNATPAPVELDEVINTFDDKTRAASQSNLTEFGNGLAGRGPDLNLAIEELNPLLVNLVPVMRTLSDPQTQLGRFVTALGRTARIVAPVAVTQSELFTNLDTTFGALARVARPFLQDSITGGPPALDEGIKDFPQLRPFLANSEALFAELRPGVAALATAAPGPGRCAGGRHAHAPALRGVQQQPQAGLRGARALRGGPAGHPRRA